MEVPKESPQTAAGPPRHQSTHDVAKHGNGDADGSRVAHTLTACCRCRSRKTRCDPALPRCGPCERTNAPCDYFDAAKGKSISRSYVVHLQHKVQELEAELGALSQEEYETPDADIMARSAGYVRFNETDEGRYLGPSSGIAITRLVMELAKQNTDSKTIKEIVPDVEARQIKARFAQEEGKPSSKVYPMISNVAAPDLPGRDLTNSLVDHFNRKAQNLWPTLHEPSFRDVVDDVYNGSASPYKNFTMRMVIAISMQKLKTDWAGLADSYYLAALQYLEDAVRPMDLSTLQCFALIAQYSLVTPTRTAAYWVVGLAARLSQELGITEEATIVPPDNPRANAIDVDMRRRLFWVITSMEFGLAHSLGRPSAFGTTYDHIDVGFFEAVDDCYINPDGVRPGSPTSMKKRIAIHFFKMRLLQAEIRRELYLRKRPEPNSDQDPWFHKMITKLREWRDSAPRDDEGTGLSDVWFQGRLNTMIVFLYRPSPQVPKPTAEAARECVEASIFNVRMQRDQIVHSIVDLTWVFTQSLFMALNAILWALSYPEIRKEYSKEVIKGHINVAQEAIWLASQRWPGVESALELYQYLIAACLKAYDGSSETSYVIDSSSSKTSPASLNDALTPPPVPRSSSFSSVPPVDQLAPRTSPVSKKVYGSTSGEPLHKASSTLSDYSHSDSSLSQSCQTKVTSQLLPFNYRFSSEESSFDPSSMFNAFPQAYPALQPYPTTNGYHGQHLGSLGEQYSQYLHAPYVPNQPFRALNQQEQVELMKTFENTPIDWG